MVQTTLVLAAATLALRAAGTLLPSVPPVLVARLAGLAPALLAALVVTELVSDTGRPELDATLAAVAVALLGAALRAPLLVCMVAAAATAGLLRLAGVE